MNRIVNKTDYSFNAAAKTITFSAAYTGLELAHIQLITNVTDSVIIYQFNKPLLSGSLSGLVLTLTYDTTPMSNTDDLAIIVNYSELSEKVEVTNAVAVTGTISVNEPVSIDDNGGSITIDGLVSVSNFPSVQPVNDNGGSLTVDNAGTFAVQENGAALTSLQLIDDVIKTEDLSHSTGDKGAFILGVRNDNNTDLTSTDGDYSPIATDSKGAVYTHQHSEIKGLFTPTGVGTVGTIQTLGRNILLNINVYNASHFSVTGYINGTASNLYVTDVIAGQIYQFFGFSILPIGHTTVFINCANHDYIELICNNFVAGGGTINYSGSNNSDSRLINSVYLQGGSISSITDIVSVSGPLTNTELRADPVTIRGTLTDTSCYARRWAYRTYHRRYTIIFL
jgi:hypothetical protein